MDCDVLVAIVVVVLVAFEFVVVQKIMRQAIGCPAIL